MGFCFGGVVIFPIPNLPTRNPQGFPRVEHPLLGTAPGVDLLPPDHRRGYTWTELELEVSGCGSSWLIVPAHKVGGGRHWQGVPLRFPWWFFGFTVLRGKVVEIRFAIYLLIIGKKWHKQSEQSWYYQPKQCTKKGKAHKSTIKLPCSLLNIINLKTLVASQQSTWNRDVSKSCI